MKLVRDITISHAMRQAHEWYKAPYLLHSAVPELSQQHFWIASAVAASVLPLQPVSGPIWILHRPRLVVETSRLSISAWSLVGSAPWRMIVSLCLIISLYWCLLLCEIKTPATFSAAKLLFSSHQRQ